MENNLNTIGQGISNLPDRPVPMEHVYASGAFNRDSVGNRIAGGLANALEQFTQDRLREIKRKKSTGLLTDMGIKPEVARFLQDIREQDPNAYTQLVQNLGTSAYKEGGQDLTSSPLFRGKGSQAQQVALEKYKDQNRDKLNYILKMRNQVKSLRDLINDPAQPVDFGAISGIAGSVPVVGSKLAAKWANDNTGLYQQWSNQLHTDLAQDVKGVRSKYYVQLLGGSKPGLDKTRGQNEKILGKYDQVFNSELSSFLRAHPEFKEEVEQALQQDIQQDASQGPQDFIQQPEQQQKPAQQAKNVGPKGEFVRDKQTKKKYQWNPKTQDYDIPVKG
jgi:hypothetical protein